ncbi:DUF58 domain-containing protein [Georgenia deserti]|uniref:DUF58 domain-containing protein n=1 Tax=Georgenia deserti TaxID=2093781 RepID=A0ABW4L5R9_9MICO
MTTTAPGSSRTTGSPPQSRWRMTHAHLRAVLVSTAGVLLALLARRPDLVVLVAPLAAIAGWSILDTPRGSPAASSRLTRRVVTEGDRAAVVVDMTPTDGAELVSTSLAATPWMNRRPRHGARVQLLETGDGTSEEVRLVTGADPRRWGTHEIGPMLVGTTTAWGAFRWGPVTLPARTVRVLPAPVAFDASAPAPRPRGLVGQHRSARPGEGTEFATIRPFQWGDRLKRIHWARSLRSRELHVTSSYADQDTHVALLVDAHIELGRSEGIDGAASSLDRSVRAAAALAEHFVRQGDRVSLQVFSGRTPLRLPPGTGQRHGRRVRDVLSRVSPGQQRDDALRRFRSGLGSGSLVVMVSALVSPTALARVAALARSGLTVVVVDALGEDTAPPPDWEPLDALAWRIRMLERDRETRRIQHSGVPVVPWAGPGSLDLVLRRLAHRGRAGASR